VFTKLNDFARGEWVNKRWHPAMDCTTRDKMYRSWQKALTRSLDLAE